jgi:TolB protein
LRARSRDRPLLHEPAVNEQDDYGADDHEDDSCALHAEKPRDDAADERAGNAETDRCPDGHRVRARDRETGESADDQSGQGEEEKEHDEVHAIDTLPLLRFRALESLPMRAARVPLLGLAALAAFVGGSTSSEAATSAATVLTNDAPTWSPDGRRIAFTSFRHGRGEIYVMNADGRQQRRLTRNTAHDDHAAWSPDGRKIAFMSTRAGNAEIHVMNANGSAAARLTNDPRNDYLPTWSPDGTRIAWRTDRDGNAEIYSMNADGTDVQRLTNSPAAETSPDWAPTGQIAFVSNRGGVTFNVYAMDPDGSNVQRVTTSQQNHEQPDWSPDGRDLLFVEEQSGALSQAHIFVIRSDGTNRRRITESEGRDDWPAFSPDGTQIVFTRGLTFRTPEIFVANADGSRARRVTSSGPQLEVVDAAATPLWPVAGRRWDTMVEVIDVRGAPIARNAGAAVCNASIGGILLRPIVRRSAEGFVRCAWEIPRGVRGKVVRGSVGLRLGSARGLLPFALRIR